MENIVQEFYEKNGVKYPVGCTEILDKGFVRLVDFMGDDSSIVQAARVSYGKGTKKVSEDEGLIRYLMRHQHSTPFEMVEAKFHCRMPIFVARQWIRHRTANVNEMSGRYSEIPDMFYVPELDKMTKQSSNNKQGGTNEVIDHTLTYQLKMHNEQKTIYSNYQNYLGTGMRKELARINLPLSAYTEWYWKIDLHNLFHFLKLRLDSHAQYEIRVFGEAMANLIKTKVPLAWKAFEDYQLNATKFSGLEMEALGKLILHSNGTAKELVQFFEDIDAHTSEEDRIFKNKREREEFIAKLLKLNR